MPQAADLLHVSSLGSNLGPPSPQAHGELEACVRSYDRDAAANGRSIRELLRANRQAFYSGALDLLKSADDSRGSQYLISVLADSHLLVQALSDLALSKAEAVSLAQAAVQAGVMADVLIAKHLMEVAHDIENICPPPIQRVIDVLAEIADGGRVLPLLMTLVRQKNPYLQSKAVLMIGRLNHNVKWVQSRLAEPDPRVRANAVEALWGVDSEEARKLLRSASRDSHGRVAGNALIGLYRLGDHTVIPELMKMAESESRRFRTSAAWVMGETGDPRFTKSLGRMVGDPHLPLRTRAFAALGQIRASVTRARQAGELRVVARYHRTRRSGMAELLLDVTSKDGKEAVKLLPTQVILVEDGQEITQYSLEEHTVAPLLAMALVFPRTGDTGLTASQQGALNALAWKRPSDLWSVLCYLPQARPEAQASLAGEKFGVQTLQPSLLDDLPLAVHRRPRNSRREYREDCSPHGLRGTLEHHPSRGIGRGVASAGQTPPGRVQPV